MKKNLSFFLLFFLIISITFTSCNSELNEYKKALLKNTIYSYYDFIKTNHNSKSMLIDSAKDSIISIAIRQDSIEFLSKFIKEYPIPNIKQGKLIIILTTNFTSGTYYSFYLQDIDSTYYLKFLPNLIIRGLTVPYSGKDCFFTQINDTKVYIHSNSTYLIFGELVNNSNNKITSIEDHNKVINGKSSNVFFNTINVERINELSRGSGACTGLLCMPNTADGITIMGPISLIH